MKLRSIFEMIPNTWAIEFASRDKAHSVYEKVKKAYESDLGSITVNNDTWYIGTKLTDADFEKELVEFLDQFDISADQYTVTKTEVGKFWMP